MNLFSSKLSIENESRFLKKIVLILMKFSIEKEYSFQANSPKKNYLDLKKIFFSKCHLILSKFYIEKYT